MRSTARSNSATSFFDFASYFTPSATKSSRMTLAAGILRLALETGPLLVGVVEHDVRRDEVVERPARADRRRAAAVQFRGGDAVQHQVDSEALGLPLQLAGGTGRGPGIVAS